MWTDQVTTAVQQILLGIIGLSSGVAVAGGLFSFIVELGVIADFADRTHTGDQILFYEDCVALGGMLGNLFFIFRPALNAIIPLPAVLLAIFGLFAGIFTGCWAMALAEILNVFPVFMRRTRIVRYITVLVVCTALGKGLGAWLFFYRGW